MKKMIFFGLLLVAVSLVNAQNSSLIKSYSTTAGVSGGMKVKSGVYGTCLVNVYPDNTGTSLIVQKNNLDGDPLIIKKFSNISLASPKLFIFGLSPLHFCVCGTKTSTAGAKPFLLILDSSNCNLFQSKEFKVSGASDTWVEEAKWNSVDQYLQIAGAVNSGTTTSGLVVKLTGWNYSFQPITTSTISIQTGSTIITSMSRAGNYTNIISGFTNNQPFLARMKDLAGGNYVVGECCLTNTPGSLSYYYNSSRLLFHNATSIFKIDTNLFQLNTPLASLTLPPASETNFTSYRFLRADASSRFFVIDTSLQVVSVNNYSPVVAGANSFSTASIADGYVNYYLSYSDNLSGGNFSLLKTTQTGSASCSVPSSVTSGTAVLTSTFVAASAGAVSIFTNVVNTSVSTLSVSTTIMCSPNSIAVQSDQHNFLIARELDHYRVTADKEIVSYDILDVTGRTIKHTLTDGNTYSVYFSMSEFPANLYLLTLRYKDGTESRGKLLN